MSDAAIRERARQATRTASLADETAAIVDRLRAGTLTQARAWVAAQSGHGPCREALGLQTVKVFALEMRTGEDCARWLDMLSLTIGHTGARTVAWRGAYLAALATHEQAWGGVLQFAEPEETRVIWHERAKPCLVAWSVWLDAPSDPRRVEVALRTWAGMARHQAPWIGHPAFGWRSPLGAAFAVWCSSDSSGGLAEVLAERVRLGIIAWALSDLPDVAAQDAEGVTT